VLVAESSSAVTLVRQALCLLGHEVGNHVGCGVEDGRDIAQSQKRPITVSKETYYSVKSYLLQMVETSSSSTCWRQKWINMLIVVEAGFLAVCRAMMMAPA